MQEFILESSYLEINPYLRLAFRSLKRAFDFFVSVSTIFFLIIIIFSDLSLALKSRLLLFGFTLLIIEGVIFFLRKNGKEDLRLVNKSRINLIDFLSARAFDALLVSLSLAEISKAPNFNLVLFKELASLKKIKNFFYLLEAPEILKEIKIISQQKTETIKNEKSVYLENALLILRKAYDFCLSFKFPYINETLLLVGLIKMDDPEINELLEKYDINGEDILACALYELFKHKRISPNIYQPLSVFQPQIEKKRFFTQKILYKPTPLVDKYALDLTLLACRSQAGFLVGHQKEKERLLYLLRSLQNNVLLIGEDGSGKETLVMHLSWLIHNDLCPPELYDFRVIKLDLALLYAEDKEKFLAKLSELVKEILASKKIILYLPDIHQIILEPNVNVMQVLNPLLTSREIPVIASTTPLGYTQLSQKIEVDVLFEKIEMSDLSFEEALILLTLKSIVWRKEHKINISFKALTSSIRFAQTFFKQKPLNRASEDLMLQAINLVKNSRGKIVTQEIIQELVASITKIPVQKITEEEKEKILNLENLLHQRIVDQEEAIKEIARVLRIYRAGLGRKKGPIGVFLFVGPTGVGKTETAKALARIYYGSENNMLRLDMVEFQTPEDLVKLIGSPDGKITGMLTEPVRQNPYTLILLDEFEKTHPTILKIFLPIFDEGLIKDALGREVDFRHSLIICTSNAYSEEIKKAIEEKRDFNEIVANIRSKLTPIFSVELMNRFDNVIVYKPLGPEELYQIAQILLKDLQNDLLLQHGLKLEVDELAIKELVRLGTDPIFGARPLKRKIEEIIKNEIANLILAEKVKRGDKIIVSFKEKFVFEVIPSES